MAINFSNITLEVIDINTNATPDIFLNVNNITFSRRVLEDLNYPQYVQYCVDAVQKIFAIRPCKGNEAKATPFAKPRAEQTATLTCSNKNLLDTIRRLVPNYDSKTRYKVVGQFDPERKILYFEMATAEPSAYRNTRKDDAD